MSDKAEKKEVGLAEAVEGSNVKAKKYLCKAECYLNGKRYHDGDIVETIEKNLPDYFVEYKEDKAAEKAE